MDGAVVMIFGKYAAHAAYAVAGASLLVNVLPKDVFLNDYPRAKKAYRAAVHCLALTAFNFRKFIPSADVKIPGLGFDDYGCPCCGHDTRIADPRPTK